MTRLRLVYRITYQRSSQKILPWRSRVTVALILCYTLLCEQRQSVQKASSVSIYFCFDVRERLVITENPVNRRLVIGADAGNIWNTPKTYEGTPGEVATKGSQVLWFVTNHVAPLLKHPKIVLKITALFQCQNINHNFRKRRVLLTVMCRLLVAVHTWQQVWWHW